MAKLFKSLFFIQSILFVLGFSFGAKLYFWPNTGNFKMLCPVSVEVRLDLDGAQSYGSRIDTIFDPIDILSNNISFSRSGYYNTTVQPDIGDTPTRLITSAYNNPISQRISGNNIILGNLNIETHSAETNQTKIEIYAHTFDSQDFSNDSSVMMNPTNDLLSETGYGLYTFSPGTCEPDTEYPQDIQYVLNLNNTDKIRYLFGFDFFVIDGLDYTKNQPGYKTDNIILEDYYYGKNQADKASGIDPNSITIEFIYNDGSKIFFSGSNPWINFAGSGKTRNRKRRDYRVSVSPFGLTDFGIEKTMKFSGHISDYDGHMTTMLYTFNNPTPPWIAYTSPNTGEENVLPKTDIILKLSDNRAGINPDSIELVIYSGGCSGLLIGYFSGNNLDKEALSGYANTPDYMVKIHSGSIYNGQEFMLPTNETEICIVVSAEDNEENKLTGSNNRYSFTTRNQCSFYDCENMFEIYRRPDILTGQIYSLPKLFITGGQNPYISGSTLYCGIQSIITLITGNISNPTEFKEDKLYISGGYTFISGGIMLITPFIRNN